MEGSFFIGIAAIAYILSMIAYIAHLVSGLKAIGFVASSVVVAGFISHTIGFGLRWKDISDISGMGLLSSIPITTPYESLILFVWMLVPGYLIIERSYKTRAFGAFVIPIAVMALAFAGAGGVSTDIRPLAPELRSNWLFAHVVVSIIACVAFAISCATSLMYMAVNPAGRKGVLYIFWTAVVGVFMAMMTAVSVDFLTIKTAAGSSGAFMQDYLFRATFRSGDPSVIAGSLAFSAGLVFLSWRYGYMIGDMPALFSVKAETLEDLTFRLISAGFFVFTVGSLMLGAIWSDLAWGSYWSWDPKETCSLFVWFVYVLYLHARQTLGWRGNRTSAIAIIGFGAVMCAYLGVNLLLGGLHYYGGN
jgi:cytochrome c-type biogenesis protein CcsB